MQKLLAPLPLKVMLPVSITYPRVAMESAICAFCSTSKIVVPASCRSSMIWKICSHQNGSQAHGGLVEHEKLGACS